VQLLQPQQARTLLRLQHHLLEQQHAQGPQHSQQLQLQLQPVTEQQQQQGQGMVLRALAQLPAKASFHNYERHGVRAMWEEQEQDLGFNCVDGDLLFGGGAGPVGAAAAAAVEQDARLLQHRLWQMML
jgi:hypothetical protein